MAQEKARLGVEERLRGTPDRLLGGSAENPTVFSVLRLFGALHAGGRLRGLRVVPNGARVIYIHHDHQQYVCIRPVFHV